MKRLAYLVALLPIVATANEATFTGGFLGGEINANKQDFSIPYSELGYTRDGNLKAKSSSKTGLALLGGYGFDLGNNFIGTLEGKISITGTKVQAEGDCTYYSYCSNEGTVSREYLNISMGYLQGYNIADTVMPYAKVSLNSAILDVTDLPYNTSSVAKQSDVTGVYGFGYGFGAKLSLTPDLELGAEWLKTSMRGSNSLKVRNKTTGMNLNYKF